MHFFYYYYYYYYIYSYNILIAVECYYSKGQPFCTRFFFNVLFIYFTYVQPIARVQEYSLSGTVS